MTIAVRSNVFGNEAEAVFTSVEDAVAHLRINPTFEIIPEQNLRPYGDVEGNAPADISEEEFNAKDEKMMSVLTDFFKEMNRKVAFEKASSYTARRWSVHWYATDCYVADKAHAEHFAKELYKQFEFPVGIKGDVGVYDKNRKFRHGNTPTAKGEVRPFVCDNWEDVFIGHVPTDADLLDFEVPVEVKVGRATKVEDAELVPLLDCIKTESWTDYTLCRNLVWAMVSCGASDELIHSYCEKATNYGMKWVDDLIRNYKEDRSPKLNFIKKIARADNRERYCKLIFGEEKSGVDPNWEPYVEEMMCLTEDENTIIDEGRYLMNLPDEDTVAAKCMLGCGKTFAMIRKLREKKKKNPKLRVLVMSGRRTWADHIHAELDGLGFVHYEKYKTEQFEKKKKITQIDADCLVLQMSPASMKLISEQNYDYLVVDECETVLTMMSFLNIYKNTDEWLLMGKTWERLMRETKQVLFMDAFLNDRTMDMLRDLRTGPIHLIVNTTQPYNKTCIEYTNKSQFYTSLINKFRGQKKRGVSIWGTVKAGTEFQEFLTTGKVKSVFYHAKSDAKQKAEHMGDVNKWWAEHQSVGYTGTITVGINYTNKDAPFDFLSLYATCWGGTARDFAQALHRAREVKDNHILAYIDPAKGNSSVPAGMIAQERLWERERSLRSDILKSFGEDPQEYAKLPEWWKKVIMRNRNEKVINSCYFEVLMPTYMRLCGINSDILVGPVEKKKSVGHSSLPSVEEVREIEPEEAEWLHNNRRGLTEEDHYALEKFKMKEKVARVDQTIWEQWNNDDGVVRNAFNVVHRTPTDLFRRQDHKVLDLVNKNIARLEVIQNCGLDWTKSWTKKVSELPELNLNSFTLRDRSEKDTPEQNWRNAKKAFEKYGLHLTVHQKRVKENNALFYAYSVEFKRENSVIDYIHPKVDLATVFND